MTEIFVYWRPRTQKLKNQRGVGEIVNNDTSKVVDIYREKNALGLRSDWRLSYSLLRS